MITLSVFHINTIFYCAKVGCLTLMGSKSGRWFPMRSRCNKLTKALEDHMEEGDNRALSEAVQLVNKGLFDHLVPRNIHHPLTASSQAEHWAVLLSELHSKADLNRFSRNPFSLCLSLANQGNCYRKGASRRE